MKNYEQLSSTISKFQAFFQKFEHYLSAFLLCFGHFFFIRKVIGGGVELLS